MISGNCTLRKSLRVAMLMCLCTANPSSAADIDARTLVERLERPAPASIEFKELRFSALLEQPLVVSGELRYIASDHLERFVKEPYREKTIVRGESVRVERDGEKLRTFALNRAPELRGLLTAFSSLLAGDPSAVERHFEMTADGEENSWSLKLVPRDARARKQLQELQMTGRSAEPTCFLMASANGARSVMLLGELATEPTASNETSVEALLPICMRDSAR